MPASDQLSGILLRLWNIRLLRFAGGGLINLCVRLLLVYLLAEEGVALWLNYAIVHGITILVAFFYHTLVTFNRTVSISGFLRFIASVFLIRSADYVFVLLASENAAVINWAYGLNGIGDFVGDNLVYFNIAAASAAAFLFRYLVFTRFTFSDSNTVAQSQETNKQ